MNGNVAPSTKVALLLPTLTGGGAERVTLNLIEGLQELGCDVELVVFTSAGELADSVPENVALIDLKCERALRSPVPLAKYLRKSRPDVLIATMGHANLSAMLARLLSGVPMRLALTEHLAVTLQPENWKDRLYRPLARWAYPHAQAIIAVSEGLADTFAEGVGIPRDDVKVIYNPVLTRGFWNSLLIPVQHPWFEVEQPPVILGVGRLVPQKDFPSLIRAFSKVRKSHDARLMILGEGPDRTQLESLVRELRLEGVVELPGFVHNAAAYMARAGVFVLSSVREGLPTVLIEALAAGAPVVSTDCPTGPEEILMGGRLGRLVPVGDADSLAAAILASLEVGPVPVDRSALQPYMPRDAARRYLEAVALKV